MFKLSKIAIALILSASCGIANAAQVITAGDISIGVQDLGALGGGGVGIAYKGADGIMPGCLCEGWGASYGTTSGWSANANGGNSNVSLVSFTSDASSALSIVDVNSALRVSQSFTVSATPALFRNLVTITNTTGDVMSDVRYSRSMDWDIPPTEFSEYVTINRGTSANLLFSNDEGFGTPNPLVNPSEIVSGTTNVSFTDKGPADHGAFFTFGFGDLAAGASKSFNIYYGAAGNEVDALAALGAVGAEVYSFGQSSTADGPTLGTPSTFIFAFSGVGGKPIVPAVPEPETYGMMIMGLGLMGFIARRRKNQQA